VLLVFWCTPFWRMKVLQKRLL